MDGINLMRNAKDLAKNPLGIIALFIVLVYGIACLLFGTSLSVLNENERGPIIYFVIFFPIIVLVTFTWLVSRHHSKLYAPSDFREDKFFIEATQNKTLQHDKSFLKQDNLFDNRKKINEWLDYGIELKSSVEIESFIVQNISKNGLTDPSILDNDLVKALLRNLSVTELKLNFELIYNIIFGTQVKVLKICYKNPDRTILKESAKSMFYGTKEKNNDILKDTSFEDYFGFLIEESLLVEENEFFLLTDKGKEFIEYMEFNKYDGENKLL